MADGAGLIERFYKEIIEGGNLSLIDELSRMTTSIMRRLYRTAARQGWCSLFVNAIRTAFPDIKVKTIEASSSDGNWRPAT